MSDNPKKVEKQMEKAIFICADVWLSVFDFLSPRKIGLGIALISHRFDRLIDEHHFKTRKWSLGLVRIWHKIGENGTKEMQIYNSDGKLVPIPQVPPPKNVVGFKCIQIEYYDDKVIAFLFLFRHIFATFGTNLAIHFAFEMHSDVVFHRIWPIIKHNIYGLRLESICHFHNFRLVNPTILSDCPALRSVASFGYSPEFPVDDRENASDGQAVAKWLFSPSLSAGGDGLPPKFFKCTFAPYESEWSPQIEGLKATFSTASSPVNFIMAFSFPVGSNIQFGPIHLTNLWTGERLALKQLGQWRFLLIRCPIVRDEQKWAKWEKEATEWRFVCQWNRIDIAVHPNELPDKYAVKLTDW